MSGTAAPPATPAVTPPAVQPTDDLSDIRKSLTDLSGIVAKLNEPDRRGISVGNLAGGTPGQPARVPYGASGEVGKDSRGYSVLKAAAFCVGFQSAEYAKDEVDISNRLYQLYKGHGFNAHVPKQCFLMPFATEHIPAFEPSGQALQLEIRQKMMANTNGFDADEAAWINAKLGGHYTKAMGSVTDTAGGVLVGFPMLGELIDLQRRMEAFVNAGCSEISLPPNGRIQYPKLNAGATAYWVGEAAAITESQEVTGNLDLQAKKLGVLVKMNNELLRYTSPSAEGLIRSDMAQVAARKADLAMFTGTGGTQIKGLLTYDTTTAWDEGTDKVIVHTAKTPATDGDTLGAEDAQTMQSKLPDGLGATAWVMRPLMLAALANRRADAVTAADGKGPFMFWISQGNQGESMPTMLRGVKVVQSRQVPNNRVKGAGTTLTLVIVGNFRDWIIARHGVMEFLASTTGDTALVNDQTWLRGIQHLDAGPRHAASFVFCDSLLEA